MASFLLRPINPESDAEIALVAQRMQLTLMEVIDEERGKAMYGLEWLIDRVRWHLDARQCTGAVYVAERANDVVGHTIVRVDQDEVSNPMGLFSTTYVAESARRIGIADALIAKGEGWMREQGMRVAATQTAETNTPLIRLYEKHQYSIILRIPESKMVRLGKVL